MTHDRSKDPIENIEWRDAESLRANDWNPNYVMTPELRLLERSILLQGWLQPVLISADGVIIDGFHRVSLSVGSETIRARYDGQVPCCVMELDEPEAMMLTIRINRAKGQHAAMRMHALVRKLIDEFGCDRQEIANGIGATLDEVDLLYQADIFTSKSLDKWEFSRAWIPKESGVRREPDGRGAPAKARLKKSRKKGTIL